MRDLGLCNAEWADKMSGWCAWVLNVREIFEKENKNYYQIKSSDDLDITRNEKLRTFGGKQWSNGFDEMSPATEKNNFEQRRIYRALKKLSPRLRNQRHESRTEVSLPIKRIPRRLILKNSRLKQRLGVIYFRTRRDKTTSRFFFKFTEIGKMMHENQAMQKLIN